MVVKSVLVMALVALLSVVSTTAVAEPGAAAVAGPGDKASVVNSQVKAAKTKPSKVKPGKTKPGKTKPGKTPEPVASVPELNGAGAALSLLLLGGLIALRRESRVS